MIHIRNRRSAPTKLDQTAQVSSPRRAITPIPRPLHLPELNRRQFLKLGLGAVSALAVAPAAVATLPAVPVAAGPSLPPFFVDGPIYKKWLKLGGAAVVGNPTSAVTASPDGSGLYQTFDNGAIIYSDDWGAQLVSTAIFNQWLVSYTAVGFPTQDYVISAGVQTGYFEFGMIIIDGATTWIVTGFIYEHYFRVPWALGLPTSAVVGVPGGGVKQSFQGGEMYWRSDSGAAAVRGAIRDRWLLLGGTTSPLGFPLSDEQPVVQDGSGTPIGALTRFQGGTIYWSGATGAWEVTGDLREAYETSFGGPSSPFGLGFPIAPSGTTATGGRYIDLQSGVIVKFDSGPKAGTWGFSDIQLFINRFEAPDEDCFLGICGTPALYVHLNFTSSDGLSFKQDRPTSDTYDGSSDLHETFDLTPGRKAHHDLVIDLDFDGWDREGGIEPSDEHLGQVHVTYTIDNLWGLLDGGDHFNKDDGEGVHFDFSTRNPLPFDPTQFRKEMFWSFSNFSTDSLSYNQFASTFSDVDPNEAAWVHPFNALYYQLAYKGVAKNGNCFGMCLESIFAQFGLSLYAEPIIRFWPDTQGGQTLDQTVHAATANEINIKHGYQLGAESIDWFLERLIIGQTHDPMQVFKDSRDAYNGGDYPILSLMDSYFGGSGHAVRPYKWDDSANPWKIYIANPNNPFATFADDADPCLITIDTSSNTYTFKFDTGDTWSGGQWFGGRMFYLPFHHLLNQPRTPFWEVLALILDGTILLLGDTGRTQQISDDSGRTLFEPGLPGLPTRWDEYTQNPAARVPNLTRVALSNGPGPIGGTGPAPIEMYYGKGAGATYTHHVVPAPGVPDGTPYEWVLNTPTLSAYVKLPGTAGAADLLTTAKLHTHDKAVTVQTAGSKAITWTMAGPVKQRWFELSNLNLAGGQSLTTQIANSGYQFSFQNSGPATTADLRVQAGPGATPVVVGQIAIPSGSSGPFSFAAPKTTLTTAPAVPDGKLGWFVTAPVITLTAKDYSSTGIQSVQYSRDGTIWIAYSSPFTYGGTGDEGDEGATTLYYYAVDNAGDVESVESSNLMVDTRAPLPASTLPATFTRVTPLVIGYSASDPTPGSGVDAASLGAVFNGGTFSNQPVSNGQSLDMFWQPLGTYTLTVSAKDVAGNAASQDFTAQLIATLASLAIEIRLMRQMGLIDSDGVTTSFLANVSAATDAFHRGLSNTAVNQLGALLNDLAAQRGKHITTAADDLLAGDVRYVQTHLA